MHSHTAHPAPALEWPEEDPRCACLEPDQYGRCSERTEGLLEDVPIPKDPSGSILYSQSTQQPGTEAELQKQLLDAQTAPL